MSGAHDIGGKSGQGANAREERFAVGDRVCARGLRGSGHTRLPRYMRDRRGVVVALRGHVPLADDRARGAALPRIEMLYTVAFEGRELWGDASEAGVSVSADLWESYLEETS